MQDSFKHKGLRNKLVLDLKTKGIKDDSVLEAVKSVPRHLFMDSGFLDHAYQDKAFPIASGQTISQPFTVPFQTELLNVKKDPFPAREISSRICTLSLDVINLPELSFL